MNWDLNVSGTRITRHNLRSMNTNLEIKEKKNSRSLSNTNGKHHHEDGSRLLSLKSEHRNSKALKQSYERIEIYPTLSTDSMVGPLAATATTVAWSSTWWMVLSWLWVYEGEVEGEGEGVWAIFKFVSVFWVLILGDLILWVLLCGFMCGWGSVWVWCYEVGDGINEVEVGCSVLAVCLCRLSVWWLDGAGCKVLRRRRSLLGRWWHSSLSFFFVIASVLAVLQLGNLSQSLFA